MPNLGPLALLTSAKTSSRNNAIFCLCSRTNNFSSICKPTVLHIFCPVKYCSLHFQKLSFQNLLVLYDLNQIKGAFMECLNMLISLIIDVCFMFGENNRVAK